MRIVFSPTARQSETCQLDYCHDERMRNHLIESRDQTTPKMHSFVKTIIIATLCVVSTGLFATRSFADPANENKTAGDYDAELDIGSSPIPDEKAEKVIENDDTAPKLSTELKKEKKKKKLSESDFGRTIEEVEPFDPYRHFLMAQLGLVSNYNAQDQLSRYTGAGVRYGLKLAHLILFRNNSTQDALFVEGGANFYKVVGYNLPTDSYSVIATTVVGRYSILLSRDFGFFGYLGTMHNFAFAGMDGTTSAIESLSTTLPAAGGGLLFGIGPNWEGRLDVGTDIIGLAVMIRF